MQKKIIFIIVLLAVIGILLALGLHFANTPKTNITVIAPTCVENGYSIHSYNGNTQIKDIVPATGHQFGEWVTIATPQETTVGLKERTCQVCGEKETESFYSESDFPSIYFEGDISAIDKTHDSNVKTTLRIDETVFDGYAKIKYQGHSSLKYDKKNFTVKFYKDEKCQDKQPFVFKNWREENKFILKANYTDVSRARNLICADVWSRLVSARATTAPRLLESSNNGAVDGFPVAVYLNNEFLGLYNLTLHKDDNLFAMEDGRKDGIMITNQGDSPEALFQSTMNWDTSTGWEIEYCGTEDNEWIQQKLNRFIDFVANSSDEEFKNHLSEYVDVDSLIDYLIAAYSLGLTENLSKDVILVTYDDGVWIASLFDMENAFGFDEETMSYTAPDTHLPIQSGQKWETGIDSVLWDRLMNLFYDEISQRYIALRKTTFSNEEIVKLIDQRIHSIPQDLNQEDFVLYPGQPLQDMVHADQLKDYAQKRLALLDAIFVSAD